MSLARPVEESLRAAQEHLRDALAFAARGEKPYVSKHIAEFLADIDNLIDAHEIIERINEFKSSYPNYSNLLIIDGGVKNAELDSLEDLGIDIAVQGGAIFAK